MEIQSEFERDTLERLERVEAAISTLASRIEALAGAGASRAGQGKPLWSAKREGTQRVPFPQPKPHSSTTVTT